MKQKIVAHEGMASLWRETELGWQQYAFGPAYEPEHVAEGIAAPPFSLGIAGEPVGFINAMVTGLQDSASAMVLESFARNEEGVLLRYRHPRLSLVVEVRQMPAPGIPMLRSCATAWNEGGEPIVLTRLSSLLFQGIAAGGDLPWHEPGRIRIHYCRQGWHQEGQWRVMTLSGAGVYPCSPHPEAGAFHLGSTGSFSTARYLPMLVVEDLASGAVWYMQMETSAPWHMQVANRGTWNGDPGGLFLLAGAADERYSGWAHTLEPGQHFRTEFAAGGCCPGGFEEAVEQLTRYRRHLLGALPRAERPRPVVFNDYMNCLWGDPTAEALTPLIDAAGAAGAEVFCIDAGWHEPKGKGFGESFGLWQPSTERFGEAGLQGVLDYIRGKGMIPGLWLEVELCAAEGPLAQKPDSWFICRHGVRVRGGNRIFLNFANPEVCTYCIEVFERLIGMGVGYFKIDYNDCIGAGDDSHGGPPAAGLLHHVRGLRGFWQEVRQRFPSVVWENCASGAMRCDYGILPQFHLQSSSDQEFHDNYPAVLSGSLAGVVPEQLGIWAYPYPHLYLEKDDAAVLDAPAFHEAHADGERTIFNMVSTLAGTPCLSGRIDKADALNRSLIQEALKFYKGIREAGMTRQSFWPMGMNGIHEHDSWAAVGQRFPGHGRVLLLVWRRHSPEAKRQIDLARWLPPGAGCVCAYPAETNPVPWAFDKKGRVLEVTLEKPCMARCFSFELPGGKNAREAV